MNKTDIKKILDKETSLNDAGFGLAFDFKKLTPDEYQKQLKQLRNDLLDSPYECTHVCEWLKNINKIKTINKRRSSYGLKHIVEKRTTYISNGAFICAAIFMGFKYVIDGPNAFFNMSEKSIKELERQPIN